MHSITQFNHSSLANLQNGTPPTERPLLLWLILGIAGYFMLKKEKKKPIQRESQTPVDLHGLASITNPESWELPSKYENLEPWQMSFEQWRDEIKRQQDKWYSGNASDMGAVAKEIKRLGFNPDECGTYKEHYQRMIKKIMPKNTQMTLLGNLSGNLRTCDAWFEVEDKRGFKSHRCFIYKPTCNTKKCKKDPNAIVGGEYVKTAHDYGVWNNAEALSEYLKDVHGDVDRDIEVMQRAARDPNVPYNDVTEAINDIEIINQRLQELESKQGKKDIVSRGTNPEMQGISLSDIESEKSWIDSMDVKTLEETNKRLARESTDDNIEYQSLKDHYTAFKNQSITASYFRNITGYTSAMAAKQIERLDNKLQENRAIRDYIYYKLNADRPQNVTIRPAVYEEKNKKKMIEEKGGQMTLFGSISGYTATCLKWGRNRLGNKQCLKYAPTCGSAAEGCRIESAPIPGSEKEAKAIEKQREVQADAMAQMLADDANIGLEQNKELMRQILDHGGIAPHRGEFLKEEYSQLPSKYKRKKGIPLDELAQQMGTDETTLTEEIYKAQSNFDYLKSLRGKTAKYFKAEDFINEAWDRISKGKGFMGFGNMGFSTRDPMESPFEWKTHSYAAFMRLLQDTALDLAEQNKADKAKIDRFHGEIKVTGALNAPTFNQARKMIYPKLDYIFFDMIADSNHPNKREIFKKMEDTQRDIKHKQTAYEKIEETPVKKEKIIAEKGRQMTLFGGLGKLIPLHTTWETLYYDTNDCKNKILTVKARKEMGLHGGKSVHGCMVTDPSLGNKFWMASEKATKMMKNPKPQQQLTLFGGYHG